MPKRTSSYTELTTQTKITKKKRRRELRKQHIYEALENIGHKIDNFERNIPSAEVKLLHTRSQKENTIEIIDFILAFINTIDASKLEALSAKINDFDNLKTVMQKLLIEIKYDDTLQKIMSDNLQAALDTELSTLSSVIELLEDIAKAILEGTEKNRDDQTYKARLIKGILFAAKYIFTCLSISAVMPLIYYTPKGIEQLWQEIFNSTESNNSINLAGQIAGILAVASLAFFVANGNKRFFERLIQRHRKVLGMQPIYKNASRLLYFLVEKIIVGGYSGVGAFLFMQTFLKDIAKKGYFFHAKSLIITGALTANLFASLNNASIISAFVQDALGGIMPNRFDSLEDKIRFAKDQQINELYHLIQAEDKSYLFRLWTLVKATEKTNVKNLPIKILLRQSTKTVFAVLAYFAMLSYQSAGEQLAEEVLLISNGFIQKVMGQLLQLTNVGVVCGVFSELSNKLMSNSKMTAREKLGLIAGAAISIIPAIANTMMAFELLSNDVTSTGSLIFLFGCAILNGSANLLFSAFGAGSLFGSSKCCSSTVISLTSQQKRGELLDLIKRSREQNTQSNNLGKAALEPLAKRSITNQILWQKISACFFKPEEKNTSELESGFLLAGAPVQKIPAICGQ